MKTQVCITVDVEFDIAGTFAAPERNRPAGPESVHCWVDGTGEGLGFILRTLGEHGLPGVFFIEVLNTSYFGDAPMRGIVSAITTAGHDVQMHLHPAWTYFDAPDWKDRLKVSPPNDSMAQRSGAELRQLLERGLAVFSRWGLPPPCAARAGSLQVNREVYDVMHDLGMPLASHLGLGIYRPADETLHLHAGRHWLDKVLEVPVTSFAEAKLGGMSRLKLLTVIGTGFEEMRHTLRAAAAAGAGTVVILTHAIEYVRRKDRAYRHLERNRLAQRRLRRLCRYLAENDDTFEVTTFSAQRESWTAAPSTANPMLRVPAVYAAKRLIENQLSERLGWG